MAKSNRTVSETVYDILYRNIINLNLVPGTVMSEKDISEKMEVSRTPVREAFIKLSNEGLVDVIPQKGSFVSKISLTRVKEERFLRESVELAVIEDLILHKKDIDFHALRKSMDQQEKAMEKGDIVSFTKLDDDFHALLFREADKSRCHDVVVSFSGHYRRARFLSASVSGVPACNLNHHRELISMIENRNLEDAITKLKEHLRRLNVEKDIIYEKYRDYFEDDSVDIDSLDLIDENNLFSGMNS
jgi:DNA-binding GntR family transcriptional regulator